jgi:choline dehydrogenase-like flavoprotein
MNPAQAWGYQTVPQKHLDGPVIAYDRGEGLGGSTSINFAVWNIGPRDDYDMIAELVGDDEWKWDHVHERYKRLESYYGFAPRDVPEQYKKYLDPKPDDHGHDGPLKIGFPPVWEKSLIDILEICDAAGYPSNPDVNTGNPIGVSIYPNTAYKGLRTTAADLLVDAPTNLQVLTDAQVAKVVFDGHTAVGISTVDGKMLFATNEVILSAGSLDTPKILMLSGVGPASELATCQRCILSWSEHARPLLRLCNVGAS